MKKFLILLVLVFTPLVLLAQDDTTGEGFDPEVLAIILAAGILGLPIDKAIKWLKSKFAIKGVIAYIVELIVCAFPVGIYLTTVGWNWGQLALYTFFVFLSVHGWYSVKKPT